jgi:8-oxo-dGTP diphosphatase
MKYCYDYPRASVTVDAIILDEQTRRKILLIKRKNNPYKSAWAFPGGFIEMDENLEDSVKREVLEETSLEGIEFIQFRAFGNVGRDPRGRNIVVVFYGFCGEPENAKGGDDAAETHWFDIDNLPQLAFDHSEILKKFLEEQAVNNKEI